MSGWSRGTMGRASVVALSFAIVGSISALLSRDAVGVAPLWAADAILLGYMLRTGEGPTGPALIGCLVVSFGLILVLGDGLGAAAGLSLLNMLQVMVGFILVGRLVRLPIRLNSLQELMALILGGCVLAPALCATIAAPLLAWTVGGAIPTIWKSWWLGAGLGVLIVAPMVISFNWAAIRHWRSEPSERRNRQVLELAAWLVGLIALVAAMHEFREFHVATAIGLVLILLATRHGVDYVAAAGTVVSAACLVATMAGRPPFVMEPMADLATRILSLQTYLAFDVLPALIVAIMTTERRSIQKRVEDSERRLSRALEGAQDGLWDWDLPTGRTYFSPLHESLVGLPAGSLRPHIDAWLELIHPDDQQAFIAASTSLLEQPDGHGEVEYRCRHRDGHWIWMLSRGTVVERDDRGRALRATGTVSDITRRKKLEQELVTTKQRLGDAVNSMLDDFDLYDPEGRLVMANGRAAIRHRDDLEAARLGRTYQELIRMMAELGAFKNVGPEGVDTFVAERMSLFRSGNARFETELRNGVWIDSIIQRTTEGGTLIVRRDITQRKRHEAAIAHMAAVDMLTDLPNRRTLTDSLERLRARAARHGETFAVLLLDLDGFKGVNDTHGHAAGDAVLVEVARRLKSGIRGNDLAARLGGDEFAVIADPTSTMGLNVLVERLVKAIETPIIVDGIECRVGTSIGVTIFPDDPSDVDGLLRHADAALYEVKRSGRGGWRIHGPLVQLAETVD